MIEKLIDKALTHKNEWLEPKTTVDLKSVSVIIPVFYPEHLSEVISHLEHIGGYSEIILVDDTGNVDISRYKDVVCYSNVKIYLHDKNYGRSAARNTGATKAKGDILFFLDQDMFISLTFFEELQRYYGCNESLVFLGLRENCFFEDIPKFSKWKSPKRESDWRINTVIDETFIDLTVMNIGGSSNGCKQGEKISIYDKMNKLKNMGLEVGKTIGFWDLPSMVISHSMAITKKDFIDIGGFPEWISGWGGEDIVLGFLACANHIPIFLSECVSYQAIHKPYSGSEMKKFEELIFNIGKYKEWAKDVEEFPVINIAEIDNRTLTFEEVNI